MRRASGAPSGPGERCGMRPRTLDHVALWLADRDAVAEFVLVRLGMHVIDRTDGFTLVGHGRTARQATLFDADGPRERGAFKHVALRVSDLEARRSKASTCPRERWRLLDVRGPAAQARRGRDGRRVRPGPRRALLRRPEATARSTSLRLRAPTGRAPASRSAAPTSSFTRAIRASPSGRCSTTSRCSWTRRRRHRRRPSGRDRGRRLRRRGEHARGLRLGARAREDRVRRAQADLLAHLADLAIAGAGMAGLVAAARARELGPSRVVFEKGTRPGGSMLLSSCVIWRYHVARGLSRRSVRRATSAPAACRRAPGRGARVARVARRAGRRA